MVLFILDFMYVLILVVCVWGVGYCMADIRAYRDDKVRLENLVKSMQAIIREGKEFLDEIEDIHYVSDVRTGESTTARRTRERIEAARNMAREAQAQSIERISNYFRRQLNESSISDTFNSLSGIGHSLGHGIGDAADGGLGYTSPWSWYSRTTTTYGRREEEPTNTETEEQTKEEETEVSDEKPNEFDDFEL